MTHTMLAAVLHGARDVRVEPCPRPEARPGMVLLRVRRAGICGSDSHYFAHGECGPFVPTRPFILGHEFVADVVARGAGVSDPGIGARVAVNPARACGACPYCRGGRRNLCRATIMLGSASTTPPTDGAFAEFVAVRADQCHVLPPELDDGVGTMIEPLAVALHAVKRAGDVSAARVLVMGGGPIGLLAAMVARVCGAPTVALADVVPERRRLAVDVGVDMAIDPTSRRLTEQVGDPSGDGFDVVLEASGARAALRQAFDLVRPGGTIVQIGTLGTEDVPLPANQLMLRELRLVGSFRYGDVFDEAIRLAACGRLDVRPLITGVFPLTGSPEALRHADDKARALKIHIEVTCP
ncbi:MAG: L-idonate 5-dehydrogenase [Planctomycetaceae bacterium]